MNARNLLFEGSLLRTVMWSQEEGEKGVAGEKRIVGLAVTYTVVNIILAKRTAGMNRGHR